MPKPPTTIAILTFLLLPLACQKENPNLEKPAGAAPEPVTNTDPEYLRADSLLDALHYQTAIPAFLALEERYARQGAWEPYIACRRKRAFCLWASRESEQAVALCQATLPEAREKLGVNHAEISKILTILGNVHADRRTEADFRACLDYYQQALNIRKLIYGSKSPELAGAYERLGIAYWLIDDYAGALPHYEKALTCLDTLSPENARAYLKIYNNLGLNYYSMGYFRKALAYFEQAYRITIEVVGKKDSKLVKYLINIARCHNGLGDPDEALDRLREAAAIQAEAGEPNAELSFMVQGAMGDSYLAKEAYDQAAVLFRQTLGYWRPGVRDDVSGLSLDLVALGKVYLKKQQPDSALLYLHRAQQVVDKNYDPGSFNRIGVLDPLGQAYQLKGDRTRARQLYEEALAIARAKAGEYNSTAGQLRLRLARLSRETGALDDALRYAEAARRSFMTRETAFAREPMVTLTNSLVDLIDVQGLTGNLLAAQFEEKQDTAVLGQSVACFRQAIAFSDSLKTGLLSAPARQAAQKQVFNIAEDALESLYWLWSAHPKPEYLEQAFFFAEKSRAAELLASMQETDAKHSAGIPEAWLDRESFLKSQVSSYRRWLNAPEHIGQPGTAFQVALFERQYVEAKYRLDTFLVHLEKQFPKYHRLKYDYRVVSLPALQRFTARRGAQCIEYFYGKRSVYAFTVSGDTVRWNKLNTPASGTPDNARLDRSVSQFLQVLTDKNNQEANPAQYFAAAWSLKQNLLPDHVLTAAPALIIVPDGRLCALPFEALLTAPHEGAYGAAPYLVRQHSVQYGWSATLLTAVPARAGQAKNLLHVAPFPNAARDSLPPLLFSLREKPANAPATLLLGEQAMADVFLREAPAYDAVHLSTHARAGQRAQPGIELYDRAVSVPEIYAQHLNASLVSLSACETGAGVYAEGEGIMSLARAFAYAGARSLVASHWPVNERSTADLFTAFYQHLEHGLPKSEALRRAKLELLAQPGVDARKAPYYWAAFTLSGADGPVDLGTGWPRWVWVLAAGCVGVGGWLFFRNRKM